MDEAPSPPPNPPDPPNPLNPPSPPDQEDKHRHRHTHRHHRHHTQSRSPDDRDDKHRTHKHRHHHHHRRRQSRSPSDDASSRPQDKKKGDEAPPSGSDVFGTAGMPTREETMRVIRENLARREQADFVEQRQSDDNEDEDEPLPAPGTSTIKLEQQIATTDPKRKHLWETKSKTVPSGTFNQWEVSEFDDPARKGKFLRLMGVKQQTTVERDEYDPEEAIVGGEAGDIQTAVNRDVAQRVNETLEQQFTSSLQRRIGDGRRGLGLGSSDSHPPLT
eukprot:TRINITY_DN35813_c0_g1_i1.p1 TRINITY_DN35813_c0_g1~~TRINITY_DN35813_c0_g1_i1.p1  ORF type:complete len:275 (+),score=51.72 TRINITY_DN35813_c0_g1_i1:2-826(+)